MATQPKAPKYQNKFAFAHNPNSKKSQIIAGIPNVGLCHRCHDIIEWRKKFRKYKPIKNFAKCASCSEKKVRSAYHLWCTDCAKGANVCPKCLLNRELVQAEVSALTQEQIQDMLVQVGMKERVRRRIWRLWENDKATDEEIKEMIMSYNPDAKEDHQQGDDDEADEEEAEAARRAALAAKRGPPPKPKAATSAPAEGASAATATAAAAASAPAAAAKPAPAKRAEEDEDEDEDDEDADYLDESEDDAEEEAQFQREQAAAAAAKRGAPPKPKAAAGATTAVEEKMAAAAISETTT